MTVSSSWILFSINDLDRLNMEAFDLHGCLIEFMLGDDFHGQWTSNLKKDIL